MSIRSPRALILVATAAALTGVAPLVLAAEPAATSQTGPGVQLLDDARRAAQEQDFSGVLEVTWSDATGEHTNDVSVRSAGGVLALGDRPSVIVEGARRFVQGSDGWVAVWSQATRTRSGSGSGNPVSASAEYHARTFSSSAIRASTGATSSTRQERV